MLGDNGAPVVQNPGQDTTVLALFDNADDLRNAVAKLDAAGFHRSRIAWQQSPTMRASLLSVRDAQPPSATDDWIEAVSRILDRCGAESIAAARETSQTMD